MIMFVEGGVLFKETRSEHMDTFEVEFGTGVQSTAAAVCSDEVAEMIAKVPDADRHELVQVIKEAYYKSNGREVTVYRGDDLVARLLGGDEFGRFMTALSRYW